MGALASNAWRSDDIQPDEHGNLADFRLDLTQCKECKEISIDILDYALRNDLSRDLMIQIADRPVAIATDAKAVIMF